MIIAPASIPACLDVVQAMGSNGLDDVPESLRIRILYKDEHIVVVSKPAHLLSVPGHASGQKRPRESECTSSTRLTGQDAWMEAIRSFSGQESSDKVVKYLSRLGDSKSYIVSIPRKYKTFRRYLERNRRRIFEQSDDLVPEKLATDMFRRIEKRQIPLMNLPEATAHRESASGQLKLLGYADMDESRSNQRLFVVHRLDCETSGVMVFARTQASASFLSRAWRERKVSKTYVAKVYDWDPWTKDRKTSGRIDLTLAPSEERLKWKVSADGKPSSTLWKVLDTASQEPFTRLELTPITGRTHQLRIHCAAVGTGIIGDSLYGIGPTDSQPSRLCLHAQKLSFPHPETTTKEIVDFEVDADW